MSEGGESWVESEAFRVEATGDCVYVGPSERAGTYRVTVSKYGYVTQTLEGLEVERDRCHVHPRNEKVLLEPDPNAPPAPPPIDGGQDGN